MVITFRDRITRFISDTSGGVAAKKTEYQENTVDVQGNARHTYFGLFFELKLWKPP